MSKGVLMKKRIWTYECDKGKYTHDNLVKLLLAIVAHRTHHFIKGEGFND